MRRLLPTLFAPIGVLLLVLSGAAAEGRMFAHDGFWASDNCRLPNEAFFQFGRVRVDFESSEIKINRARRVSWKGGKRISIWPVRLTGDDRTGYEIAVEWLEGGKLYGRSRFVSSEDFRKFENSPNGPEAFAEPADAWLKASPFEKCEGLPSRYRFVHGMAATFADRFRAIVPTCAAGAQACAERVTMLFDVSGNGKLSRAEVARGLRLAGYFLTIAAKSAGGRFPVVVKDEDMMASEALATVTTPLVASGLVAGNDYDNDGELSLKEIFADFSFETSRFHDDFQKLDKGVEALFRVVTKLGPMLQAIGSR